MPSNSPEMNNKENCPGSSKQVKARAGTGLFEKERKNCSSKSPLSAGNSPPLSKKLKVVQDMMNTDEEAVLTVKARAYRVALDGGEVDSKAPFEWIKWKPGPLRLYKNKDGRTRLVLRSALTGVVKLNLAIKGNVFHLEEEVKVVKKRGQKPKKAAFVRFFAKADEETGLECFLLKVKLEKLDILYNTLEELGAEVKEEN